ncbi:MAG: type II secretion system protein [Gammaproteobacteria bacterium]
MPATLGPDMPKIQPLTFHKSRHDNGYTLIEILAAMTILSIAMLGLVPMSMSTARYTNNIKNQNVAMTLARDKIDDLKRMALIATLTNGNNSTETNIDINGTAGNGIFTRTVAITGGADQLTTLTVTLTWTDFKSNTLTQTTMLSQ